ncbi:MAG: sigma-70 family RNA polymerase sigma factor [Bacillota bacterium]
MALVAGIIQAWRFFMGSLANSRSFQQPLSDNEEAVCLAQMRAGSTAAKNTLVERNLRLVAHLVKKFDNTGQDTDDLISIGTIGLIKAINTFNPDKGTRLATYAARCIENEASMT